MPYQHDAQIANIATSYATCLAGIIPLLLCVLNRRHPPRWMMVYLCVLVTGIPTVWLHAREGDLVAGFFDVGTNILLAWVVQIAASGDFMKPAPRRMLLTLTTVFNVCVWSWLIFEVVSGVKRPIIRFGEFGHFNAGEMALIINSWIGTVLMFLNLRRTPRRAHALLYLTFVLFFIGMILATASNKQITWYILPWHATWHIVSAFGFVVLWAYNHERFFPPRDDGAE